MLLSALTRGDVLGCLRCVVAFAALLLAPGYCMAWVCDLLGFRARPAGERLAWAVAFSFGTMTIVAVELGKYASLAAVCWLAVFCAAGFAAIIASEFWKRSPGFGGWGAAGAGIALVWAVFVVAELVDVGVGDRLYLSITVFDHALRTAFVDAVMRTGVPPANPLYWPGQAAPMRYYYFWYVLTAAAARLGHATARQAMIASVVWSGFGLASVVALYCRHYLGARSSRSEGGFTSRWPRTALALALLLVTGLDILPALAKAILRLPMDGDMDWWSFAQVTSWMDSLLWVPHHMAGLVCCLFGFLLVWMSKGRSRMQCALCAVVAGLSFAGAFGLSTWVAVAFAMTLLVWMLWVLGWEPSSRSRVSVLLVAGLVAVLTLMPYLAELRGAASNTAVPVAGNSVAKNASGLLRFGVRHMIDPDGLLVFPWFAELPHSHPRVEDAIAGLVLLVPGYFIELGFYGMVLVAALRAMRGHADSGATLDESARTSLVLVCAVLTVATLLRSTVVMNNDFGMRSILIAQFFLLLLAVRWCEGGFGESSRWLRSLTLAMMGIGVAGTVYQAVELRLYLPVQDRLGRPQASGLAERAMALRRAFDSMDQRIPHAAVIQFDTAQPSDLFRYAQIMQAGRQMATALPECVTAFGGDPAVCPEVEQGAGRLFSLQEPSGHALSATDAVTVCGRLEINDLVATRWDSVWGDPSGWVWNLPAAVDTGEVRVVHCSP